MRIADKKQRNCIAILEVLRDAGETASGEQIAEMMGARVGTVWTWLHRARARLQAALLASGQGAG